MLPQPYSGPTTTSRVPMGTYGTLDTYNTRGSSSSESRADAGMPIMTSDARRNARLTAIFIFAVVLVAATLYWQTSGSPIDRTTTQLTTSLTPTALHVSHSGGGSDSGCGRETGDISPQATQVPHLRHEGIRPTPWSIYANLPVWATNVREGRVEEDYAGSERYPELDFTVTNFYHERDGKPGSHIPWLQGVKLAEPYRDTTLRVLNPREGYSYTWKISSISDSKHVLARATGFEAVVSFTRLDLNTVSLTEALETSGKVVREKMDTVMVKYVRREIRTLTDAEREELLDAMLTLWKVKVKDGNGRQLYGDDYQDIWALNRIHFKAGGERGCDHFHAGLGFLTSHVLLTNTFERSLQIVNPKLTLPYWDFTIETSTAGGSPTRTVESQKNSPLLTAKWFGSHDPDDFMVKDGRWAFTEIPQLLLDNPGQLQADVYSKMRSPWNVNHRPYLTRGMGRMCGVRIEEVHPWPTCEDHHDLSTKYSTFYSWVWTSMYKPHGGVHAWIGGVLDCSEMHRQFVDLLGEDVAKDLVHDSFIHRKTLWRKRIFSCDGRTGVGTMPGELFESGQCGCPDYDLEQGDDYLVLIDALAPINDTIGAFPEDTQRQVFSIMCSTVLTEGDHLQSSSSLDPTFWLTHPTMERLWMFKRLSGTLTNLTWPDNDVDFMTKKGEEVSWILSQWNEDCSGHRGSDVYPFGLMADEIDKDFKVTTGIQRDGRDIGEGGNSLTNAELLEYLDPRVNSLTYIYDTFEWSHCKHDGFDMSDALLPLR